MTALGVWTELDLRLSVFVINKDELSVGPCF